MSIYNMQIQISAIQVRPRYYSFRYKAIIGKQVIEDKYESDHAWDDDLKGFRAYLKDSGALEIVLERISHKVKST